MSLPLSSEWPEKKFCSNTESFFLCRLWATFGVRRLGRMVRLSHTNLPTNQPTNQPILSSLPLQLMNAMLCYFVILLSVI